jgi:hypothetical protein
MPKLTYSKGHRIVRAVVEVNDSISSNVYNHGYVSLYNSANRDEYDSKILTLEFQRHRLDYSHFAGDRLPKTATELAETISDPRFDFGPPFSKFYGGQTSTKFDMFYGVSRLNYAAKIINKLNEAIRVYNINAVTNCELRRVVEALAKLAVSVEYRFYSNDRGPFDSLYEVSNDIKGKAYALLLSKKEQETAAAT